MYVVKDGAIRISVRNFVEFICNSGDIDNRRSSLSDVKAMQEGARIHRKIQKEMGPIYKAEVPLKIDIPVQEDRIWNYSIILEGRADGIIGDFTENEDGTRIPLSDITIDEIKTMNKDVLAFTEPIEVHRAQAMCYAYIFAVQNELDYIHIQMTYVNSETEMLKRFSEQMSFEELDRWFWSMISRFRKWTDFLFTSNQERTESARKLEFPFSYRKGQKKVAVDVYRTIARGKTLFIEAPTGLGKTISTVYPAVKAVGEGIGDKIFYLTAKTITRSVAEDTFELLRDHGLQFRTVTLTAKDKICPMEERECNPEACSRAKGHFDRENDAVYDIVTHEAFIDRTTIEQYAQKHCVCPFEMSLDISYWCDGIICDYNYVFDPNVRLRRFFSDGDQGDYIFLVDEAHNLVDRAREMYSAQLVKEDFLMMKKLVKDRDKRLASQLDKCNKSLLELKRECETYCVVDSISHFMMSCERVFYEIQKFFENEKAFPQMDLVLDFYLQLRHFLNMYEILDDKYITYTEQRDDGTFALKLLCVDPSGNISTCLSQGISTIFFSATLLPVSYYKEMLTGNTDDFAIYAETPFQESKRRLMIANDVSSRYRDRTQESYHRISMYIRTVVAKHQGNYLVFFPSYRFLESVWQEFEEDSCDDIYVLKQNSSMTEQEREDFLEQFQENSQKSVVGLCVTGGVFSEGIDLKYNRLIGAIIIGTGLPMICNERQILRYFFDENGKNGYQYAYVYPGMNKVLQAAGRVIRTEQDEGVIVLLDQRFLTGEYRQLFPREWNQYAVVSQNNIENILDDFWHRSKGLSVDEDEQTDDQDENRISTR